MPEAFDKCQENGGKVRTVTGKKESDRKQFGLNKDEYMHICVNNGNVVRGEKKKQKSVKK